MMPPLPWAGQTLLLVIAKMEKEDPKFAEFSSFSY